MPDKNHISGLDGLRGLAALAVFCVHFNQVVELDAVLGPFDFYRLMANGEHGVALFFALSGFLLSLPFWKAMINREAFPDVRVYATRRALRILPAYYVCLLVLVIGHELWRIPAKSTEIFLHFTLLFNYAEFSIFSINPPFWTLAVEAQFYLLLPLLFMMLWRFTPVYVIPILLAIAATAYAAHFWLLTSVTGIIDWPLDASLIWIRPYGAVLSHSLLGNLPHFLLGMIAGCCFLYLQARQQDEVVSAWLAEVMFWTAGLAVLVLLATELGDQIQLPYGRYGLPLVPILLTLLILATPFTRLASGILESTPLQTLGALSYGIYIYHWPCLTALDQFLRGRGLDAAQYPLWFGIGGLTMTLIIATISYLALERPLLRRAHRRANQAQ